MALVVNNLPANAGDRREVGLIPGRGRSPGGGNHNPLRYSCLENPMDRGAWWATVHRVVKSWILLKQFSTPFKEQTFFFFFDKKFFLKNTMMFWQNNRQADQWDRIEKPE